MLRRYVEDFARAARAQGVGRLSFYIEEMESRSLSVYRGELERLERAAESHIFIEGEVEGLSGSVFVEDLRPELLDEHVRTLRDSALELRRPFQPRPLYALPEPEGEEAPELPLPTLTDRLLAAERAACATDGRIQQVQSCAFSQRRGCVTLMDGEGRRMTDRVAGGHFHIGLVAREGGVSQMGSRSVPLAWGALPDMEALARQAAEEAVSRLHAGSCATGPSPVVLDSRVVCELVDAFAPAFFAKNVQNRMSVLAGRLGQAVAGTSIYLEEDPLLPDGLSARRFDDEGVPTSAKTIVDGGVLRAYLYNRKTAVQDGAVPGGNGFKPLYRDDTATGYTNLVLRRGAVSRATLLAQMGEGLLITGVSGVFAGAHPASGDFSLIAQGRRVSGGVPGGAVSQITIAGDFFGMLRGVRGIGGDASWLRTGSGCVCAPSLYLESLDISGGEGYEKE